MLLPPRLEREVGMLTYASKAEGIGKCRIKQKLEDFIVEEVTPAGEVLSVEGGSKEAPEHREGCEYLHLTLRKEGWDTLMAVRELARRLGISKRRIGFAGTKDKEALTAQRISIRGVRAEDLLSLRIGGLDFYDFSYAEEPVSLGQLWGNRFTIKLRELRCDAKRACSKAKAVLMELSHRIPNFFGLQRFGTRRPITHLVGKLILEEDFEGAVNLYLTRIYEEESSKAKKARKHLAETQDPKEALKLLPKSLAYEAGMLNHLIKHPGDWIGALRVLPLRLRRMFIHAYQSYVFNRALSEVIGEGAEVQRLALPGWSIEPDPHTTSILEEEGIAPEAFKVPKIPELSSRGEWRDCWVEVQDFSATPDAKALELRFALPKGSYATSLIREVVKDRYW